MSKNVKCQWRFRNSQGEPPAALADELDISPALLGILWRRGFTSKESINDYLDPRLRRLTPPMRWPRIADAAKIIADGLLAGKKFAVWGDYDVDGITAATLVLDVIEAHGFAPMHHLPDRRKEGYGVNCAGIEELAAQGCQLLLTVDCGISDAKALARAVELGLTVVVSDHHLPPQDLPVVSGIVDPRMSSEDWPCDHLAGVGVAFYLMAAVNSYLAPKTGKRYKMDDALDLVALGTLADVCVLEGENRILTSSGLGKMTMPMRQGLAALKIISGFDMAAELNSDQVVFRLAPRINAAGRMGHPDLALKLLRCRDFETAKVLASKLDECNSQRKSEEDRAMREAEAQAEELLARHEYAALALCGENWHPGIVGIVASRITEKFNMPAVVLTREDDALKGSGRAVAGFDLYAALQKCSGWLSGFGGHKMAAGLRLKEENLAGFRKSFSDAAQCALGSERAEKAILLDGELGFATASDQRFLNELKLMQPFGEGNDEPVFASPLLEIKSITPLGHSGEHVTLSLFDKKSGTTLQAKAWRRAHEFTYDLQARTIRVAYTPRLDCYRGTWTINLDIKDWRREAPDPKA